MDRELLWLASNLRREKRGELCSKLRIASSQFRLSEIGDLLIGRFPWFKSSGDQDRITKM